MRAPRTQTKKLLLESIAREYLQRVMLESIAREYCRRVEPPESQINEQMHEPPERVLLP